MSNAEAYLDAHGFPVAGEFTNTHGEHFSDVLDRAPGVRFEGVVWPRWQFPDGSAVVVRCGSWEVER